MTRETKDHTGARFGRLVAVKFVEWGKWADHKWLFKCDCGGEKIVGIKQARSGHTSSCGCLARETLVNRNQTHGLSRQRPKEYRAWKEMRSRCTRSTHDDFKDYGGRGIRVSEKWNDFAAFFADMGSKPEGTSLDRIDVNGHYEPGNCRWATPTEQANNKRSNRKFSLFGVELTLEEWCRVFDVPRERVAYRLNVGYAPMEALFSGDLRR